MFSFSDQYSDDANSYRLVSALFIRLLAVIYLIAFVSISGQIVGLAGSDGILPLSPWLDYLLNDLGAMAFVHYPMIFWFESSDWFLQSVAWTGAGLSLLLFFNLFPRTILILLFVGYLSLVTAGQTFMNFQWDGLLLEAGFLAIFLRPDSRVIIFLFRWLLFRLRFMSGISKLVSGDPSWAGMTALIYYFETQPLPPVGAWYFHNLPQNLLIAATVLVLIIEIIVPLMMFLTRRYRLIAAWITLLFQVLIMVSSNHNWFNFLTIALCLFLFDDKAVRHVVPPWLERWLVGGWSQRLGNPISLRSTGLRYALALLLVAVGLINIQRMVMKQSLESTDFVADVMQQWHIVNSYHVFPTMTTRLIELEIEGSLDGEQWQAYQFHYRPDDLDERPQIVLPHHPRLDWMTWFVPFHPRFLDWFDAYLNRLLDNSPSVTALLEHNPFEDQPPNFIRVRAWHYQFTTPEQKANTGNWWKRTDLGPFTPLPGKYRIHH